MKPLFGPTLAPNTPIYELGSLTTANYKFHLLDDIYKVKTLLNFLTYKLALTTSPLVSSVGMVTSYGLDDPSSIPGRFSPQRPDLLYGQLTVLSNWHRGLFPREQSNRYTKPTTHFHSVLRSRNTDLYLHGTGLK